MDTEKLQKVLARLGLGSRRELETWITAGRVSIDGKVATLGERVNGSEKIRVDGELLRVNMTKDRKTKMIVYNKPEGEICTASDPEDRVSVFEKLPRLKNDRWVMVGRLDINTQGLLLFTNNGELANYLMHPSSEIEREYAVRVMGEITKVGMTNLTEGVELDDGPAKFESVKPAGGEGLNQWYHVVLKEGRNREVRRLFESQELTVSRLIRIRFADVLLPRGMRRGTWEYLEAEQVKKLAANLA